MHLIIIIITSSLYYYYEIVFGIIIIRCLTLFSECSDEIVLKQNQQ
jgi:hypothetical protein